MWNLGGYLCHIKKNQRVHSEETKETEKTIDKAMDKSIHIRRGRVKDAQ